MITYGPVISDEDQAQLDAFDQSKTLAPIPMPRSFYLHKLLAGVTRGDELFDAMDTKQLARIHRTGECDEWRQRGTPTWVDWSAVRRGQRLHLDMFLSFLVALTRVLLNGFVIGRFSEVLYLAGYTKDGLFRCVEQWSVVAYPRFRLP